MLENREFLVEVAREEGEEGDYGEDYVGYEGVGAGGEGGCDDQTDGDFEHVVAEREVGETVPGSVGVASDSLFGVAEVVLGGFVEAWHFGRTRLRWWL